MQLYLRFGMDLFKIVANDKTAKDIVVETMDDANDEEEAKRSHGGSRLCRGLNVERESSELDDILYRQYFSA